MPPLDLTPEEWLAVCRACARLHIAPCPWDDLQPFLSRWFAGTDPGLAAKASGYDARQLEVLCRAVKEQQDRRN